MRASIGEEWRGPEAHCLGATCCNPLRLFTKCVRMYPSMPDHEFMFPGRKVYFVSPMFDFGQREILLLLSTRTISLAWMRRYHLYPRRHCTTIGHNIYYSLWGYSKALGDMYTHWTLRSDWYAYSEYDGNCVNRHSWLSKPSRLVILSLLGIRSYTRFSITEHRSTSCRVNAYISFTPNGEAVRWLDRSLGACSAFRAVKERVVFGRGPSLFSSPNRTETRIALLRVSGYQDRTNTSLSKNSITRIFDCDARELYFKPRDTVTSSIDRVPSPPLF